MFPPKEPTSSFPYQVEGQVGTGSMGVVYRATEVDLDRPVAIKILRQSMLAEEPPAVQDELRKRFLQEARAAAALSHPGVTTVFRVGEEGDLPYMVMEWLAGSSLDVVFDRQDRFAIPEANRLILELLDALATAHRHGVVHRDIKPSNLMLLDDGRLKVTDFGIALLKGRELVKTQAGVVLATPKFASPEQLQGLEVDGRADLFSTGILFYRMLTGHYPFNGEGFIELANAILQEEPPPVREFRPEVSPAVEGVIRKALRKNRKDRYATAEVMADELRAATGTTGSIAVPAHGSPEEQTQKIGPVQYAMPRQPAMALVTLVENWPSQSLPVQSTDDLLGRLLEKPLHAAAFSGAVMLGRLCLFISDGRLVGAVDRVSGEDGDAVLENLQPAIAASLHPLPASMPTGLVALLATVLHPLQLRHADLDSSFVNIPAMTTKLREERFDGLLRLRKGEDWALFYLANGDHVLSIFSEGWQGVPVDKSWYRWISDTSIRVDVSEKVVHPLQAWYRRALKDFEMVVRPVDTKDSSKDVATADSSSRIRQFFSSSRTNPLRTGQVALSLAPGGKASTADANYENAAAYRALRWALERLPGFFVERDKVSQWKYLSEWLLQVRRATIHHALSRPKSAEVDTFDIVTTDEKGKVLHLGHRVAEANLTNFEEFIERVIAAKTARIKTGDIGGALFFAPSFPEEVLEAYSQRVHGSDGRETLTGYAGFVRMGPRRGFHLLLVEEGKDDTYTPLLVG